MLDLQRVYTLLVQGRWFWETSCHGEYWLGLQRYNAGCKCAKATLEITFDPVHVEFISQKLGTDEVRRFEAKVLTKTDLMGELTPLARLAPCLSTGFAFLTSSVARNGIELHNGRYDFMRQF